MALQLETIRATADRVAASHHLDLVDIEFTGGAKHRTLRLFVEKDRETREKMAASGAHNGAHNGAQDAAHPAGLPPGVPVETLSGVTHEDCAAFARDFGTLLDVEDLVPGAEYTLEVSSPGLERKLLKPADYERFKGSLVKLQTFAPVPAGADSPGKANRHFTGRLTAFAGNRLTLDLAAIKQKGNAKKSLAGQAVTIELANIEKANLVAEI